MPTDSFGRRAMLKLTATAAGTVLLAGCSGGSGSDGADGDGEDGSTPAATATPEPTQTATETTSDDGGTPGDVDREIHVEADSFTFTPGSDEPIVVQEGETVELSATALDDGIGQGHGLAIKNYDVNLAPLFPDETKSTVFVADEAGEFEIFCSIQCSQPGAGTGHNQMTGTFVVESA